MVCDDFRVTLHGHHGLAEEDVVTAQKEVQLVQLSLRRHFLDKVYELPARVSRWRGHLLIRNRDLVQLRDSPVRRYDNLLGWRRVIAVIGGFFDLRLRVSRLSSERHRRCQH